MTPRIVNGQAFWVLGLQEVFTEENEDHPGLWKRFMAHHDKVAPHRTDGYYYGAYFAAEFIGALDCLAGVAVPERIPVPKGLTLRRVPPSTFAVFVCMVSAIHATWQSIFAEWLPASDYGESVGAANYDKYPPNCKWDSAVQLHLAIRERGA